MKKKLVVENTEYSLLLYMLLDKDWKKSDYVLCTDNKLLLSNLKTLGCNVLVASTLYIDGKYIYIQKLLYVLRLLMNSLRLIHLRSRYSIIYGNDDLFYSRLFRKNNFQVVEDGTFNYLGKEGIIDTLKKQISKYWFSKLISKIFINHIPFGYDNSIKKVYLTQQEKVPIELKDKAEFIDLTDLWNKCNYKKELLFVFGLENELINSLRDDNCCFLFPYPLSERDKVKENALIKRYQKAIKKSECKVYIKPHRFDIVDYSNYFKAEYIINKNLPFELFVLNDIYIENVIVGYDTSLLAHLDSNVNVINY